jgi:ABC-type Na+ transport system ATPase subunit NatA
MKMTSAVQVEGLGKAYGSVVAVDDVSFEVREGEIFGIVGPNGAGKTTAIECLEGMRRADHGQIEVLGLDPVRDERKLRQRIGVQLQQSALPARIKVWEALDLFASFFDRAIDWRILLDRLGLADKRSTAFAKLSGGQKQRLFIALALLNNPELVFFSRVGERVQFIELGRVTHFQARDKLTYAVTSDKSLVDSTIAQLEQKLDPRGFIRIHRATLLNLTYVDEIHSWFAGGVVVRLKDEKRTELPVARARVRALKRLLGF